MKNKDVLVKLLINQELESDKKDDLVELLTDDEITINVENKKLTFGEKLADKISSIVGSWPFIIFFCMMLLSWITLNGFILSDPYDPFPFILLNLFLSCVAAIQAPIIMMSQNRQAKKDSLRNENDYRTDLKTELIIEELYNKISICIKNDENIIKYLERQKRKK